MSLMSGVIAGMFIIVSILMYLQKSNITTKYVTNKKIKFWRFTVYEGWKKKSHKKIKIRYINNSCKYLTTKYTKV